MISNMIELVKKKLCELGNVKRKNSANPLKFWTQVPVRYN